LVVRLETDHLHDASCLVDLEYGTPRDAVAESKIGRSPVLGLSVLFRKLFRVRLQLLGELS
jgi:hypothetical protein